MLLLILTFAGIALTYITGIVLVPILMTPRKVVSEIVKKMELKKGDTLYDLGSGDMRVLLESCKEQPEVKCVGYEISPILNLLARLKLYKSRWKNVQLKSESFFKADLSRADKIYCYLNERALGALSEKIEEEARNESVIYSYEYKFPEREPFETHKLSNDRNLYIYRGADFKE